jgi:predicted glycogen debranching enzyme
MTSTQPLRRSIDVNVLHDVHAPEWLVANGLGGYASGTIRGAPSRRYHALLVAALPAPLGRVVTITHVSESIAARKANRPGGAESAGLGLSAFSLENGLPTWHYEAGDAVIERVSFMPHAQNTTHVIYRLVSGSAVGLLLRPYAHFRPLAAPVDIASKQPYVLTVIGERYELRDASGDLCVRMRIYGSGTSFTASSRSESFTFALEALRGYPAVGALWTPGAFYVELEPAADVAFSITTESWDTLSAHAPQEALHAEGARRARLLERAVPAARTGLAAELAIAADQFVITPAISRTQDVARARAAEDDVRSVIAGYHWFTDWGRDAMVSLEGLTLATGRYSDAGCILRTFARYMRDGLIPNLFPEGSQHGVYHSADATLWFFHAVDRYLAMTRDTATLREVLPKLIAAFEHHVRGTCFGIGVDPSDGLLRQGSPEHPLTWMDAQVGDWIVTPRRGKPVEVNALWYNALRLLETWLSEAGDEERARDVSEHARRAYDAFNRRFWCEDGKYLYDVLDSDCGDDASCRPNQIFAISLRHPVLEPGRWRPVLEAVDATLLTPRGLRSLTPVDPDFHARYDGDRRSRDAAYHEGTVWPWLFGAWADAWLKVDPHRRAKLHARLAAFTPHLSEGAAGFVSEIFDAEPPFAPRGCIAQAWSVAELLRALVKTA